ncbi:aa3-type cytochrome oxidase subunit IV [Corynebacterium variabile]|uniref:aa3-type cytochrome oxidase subunit IV n=1 Tax=Corynebacterium variabile TaxID=1727 RepID=UPI0028A875CB|nr:cytochrome c oxidase subunit 4 [Corynebacterium variabile]
MRQTAKLMYGLAAFLVVLTVLYFFATSKLNDNGNGQGIEWAGGTGLVLATLLCLFLGGYFHLTNAKADIEPKDWEQAEIEDGAGVLGFFSASSGWPFLMAFAIMLMGYGIAFFHIWLILMGAVMLVWSTIMLNLQYGLPPEKD